MAGRTIKTRNQIESNDRMKKTKEGHKTIFDLYVHWCRMDANAGGLGLEHDWVPEHWPGYALKKEEMRDTVFASFLWHCFDEYQRRENEKMKGKMRKVHGYFSYCAVKNGYNNKSISNSPKFPAFNGLWNAIWNDLMNEEHESAVAFTVNDLFKIDKMAIRIQDGRGRIHKDWLRRKLFFKLQKSSLRRGCNIINIELDALFVNTQVVPGRAVLTFETAYSKTNKHKEFHFVACECGLSGRGHPNNHIETNESCVINQYKLLKRLVEIDERGYCKNFKGKPCKALFRAVHYQKGEKSKKIDDDEKLRYYALKPWGAETKDIGWKANNGWLDRHLALSCSTGTNVQANRNKVRKGFTS